MGRTVFSSTRGAARRERLVRAAAERFHCAGVPATALAEVARAADVPPGNMFYYFRTKEALAEAVADDWAARVDAALAQIDAAAVTPRARLALFLDRAEGRGEDYARHGCPLAGLARDLRQQAAAPTLAAAPLERLVAWVEAQLAAAGDDEAGLHARFVVAALQGSYVLAHASGKAAVVGEIRFCLERWLEGDSGPGLR